MAAILVAIRDGAYLIGRQRVCSYVNALKFRAAVRGRTIEELETSRLCDQTKRVDRNETIPRRMFSRIFTRATFAVAILRNSAIQFFDCMYNKLRRSYANAYNIFNLIHGEQFL